MSFTIAVAGKGGSGKTTISALIIRYLLTRNKTPVLAVDADANANLSEGLGLTVGQTVGGTLAGFMGVKMNIPAGMTKEAYLEVKLNQVLVESKGLDLLTMGRGEGPDCYCYPNVVLRKFVDNLSDNYAFVVMDNEAGMEHLSRGTTKDIDELLLVSNATVKGVRTIARIQELLKELNLTIKNRKVVINMVRGELDPAVVAEMERLGITPSAVIPEDDEVVQCDLRQKPILELPATSQAVRAVDALMDKILQPSVL